MTTTPQPKASAKKQTWVRSLATRIFSEPIAWLRDLIAAKLLAPSGITPNMLTVIGMVFTLIGAWFLATGAEQTWDGPKIPAPFWAAVFFILACAMDMLDGALARAGNLGTTFGGILDSCLDRVSDMAIFGALAIAFARMGNLTFAFLSLLAICHAVMISYIKARSECILPAGTIGFWQRGERMAGILIACFAANVNTLVWMMAFLPAFSAAYRLWFVAKQAQNPEFTRAKPTTPWQFWRYSRGAWPYVIPTGTYILLLAYLKLPAPDFLAKWLNP
jgi:CDP-diacylglycerol--glycerol-3-phosphate 3-phosphatidyltransferase